MKIQPTLSELEDILGPPDAFIPSQNSRQHLSRWALAIGVPVGRVYAMTTIQLGNLYHEKGSSVKRDSTKLQRIAADMLLRLIETIQSNKVDPDFMRAMIIAEIENLPTRKVEIVTNGAPVILNGPLHCMTELTIKICSLAHPIMLVGPAGCGKTTIGKHTSIALSLPFYITSTINDTHELTGFVDGHGAYHRTPFRDAFEFGGIWLADEIDAWDASALLAANAALANGYAVFPDSPQPIYRHANFRMIATANTFGHGADRIYIGRNELDGASLDRFATLNVDYDATLERQFCNGRVDWLEFVWNVRRAVTELKIRHVVSSRAIINGAAALSVGIPRNDVEQSYLFKGMSAKDREKVAENLKDGSDPF